MMRRSTYRSARSVPNPRAEGDGRRRKWRAVQALLALSGFAFLASALFVPSFLVLDGGAADAEDGGWAEGAVSVGIDAPIEAAGDAPGKPEGDAQTKPSGAGGRGRRNRWGGFGGVGGGGDLHNRGVRIGPFAANRGRTADGSGAEEHHGVAQNMMRHRGEAMEHFREMMMKRKEEFANGDGDGTAPRMRGMGMLAEKLREKAESGEGLMVGDFGGMGGHLAGRFRGPRKDGEERKKLSKTEVKKRIEERIAVLRGEGGARSLARGVAGLPMDQTPALEGAARGHIDCDVDVDALAYWNDPQGNRDREFVSPFAGAGAKYVTFQPDAGGWNNIRMSMENMFVFAAALGRTLVLPPPSPLYLLKADSKEKHRGFADFYPLGTDEFNKRVEVISMEEFLRREGGPGGKLQVTNDNREALTKRAEHCENRAKSDISCEPLFNHLKSIGYIPEVNDKHCVIFDEDKFQGNDTSEENKKKIEEFCVERTDNIFYIDSKLQEPDIIHFKSSEKGYRIVSHFYGFILFTNPAIDNFYKRFVRDFLHYKSSIFCAAGKIVKALQEDGKKLGFEVDEEGGAGFSSLHVRRGDLQYKKVKISAEEWYENTKELWEPKEILYIATDERNKTFFDPIKEHHELRFLDDYWDMAGLSDLDPNYMGMIDTIVAARGRNFAGTYFSTFTGYITRMRGYYGMSSKTSYYGLLKYKNVMQEWHQGPFHIFAHEWQTGWVGIDGDDIPSQDKF